MHMTIPSLFRGAGVAPETPDRMLRHREVDSVLDRYSRPGAILELGSGPGCLSYRSVREQVVRVDLKLFPGLDVRADGCHLPFRNGAFITTICNDVLEHVPFGLRAALVGELCRVTVDLLIIGGPMGPLSERCDQRLAWWFRRTGRPVPDWLAEHLAIGTYPAVAELNALVGRDPLSNERGIGLGAHSAMSRLGSVRGGTMLGRAAISTPRGRAALFRVTGLGHPYRTLLSYDVAPVAFSVIMATRNRAHRLPAAIESVRAQSETDWELIVVNDASDDETSAAVRGWQEKDPRIRLIETLSPTGSCGLARNVGLRSARGHLVAFCDDDIQWHRDHLALCRAVLEQSEACYTRAARFLPDGQFYDLVGRPWEACGPQPGDVDANTIAVRRNVMRPFPDGRGRYASEDSLLALRLFRQGVRFELIPDITVDYTFNPESHCFRYAITEEAGRVTVSSRPAIKDWRAAKGRLLEAVETRAARFRAAFRRRL